MNAVIKNIEPHYEELRVSADGGTVAARATGQGAPIVLFHSLLADDTSFDRIVPALAATHRVIVLSLPGFGESDRAEGGLEAVADRIAAAIAAMDLGQPPILLGNGYGGFVALTVAIRHPGIASRLVLADCGAAFSEAGRAAFRGMSAMAREKGLAGISDVAMRRLFAPAYQAAHPELIEERRARFVAVDAETFHAACAALATLDLRGELARVQVPALVLVGEHDEATPPAMAHELAAGLPQATLTVLPGCAHVPQLQEPALFMDAIRDFIGG
ncbi:alpha/beta fold hydrolase [Noviherbaspirillum pedocola]|uniref:Alpha/beta fold hydrolase n=1 Tax=Noviherbaspirillum pedocola TaxID=2801341 RepID=A0A934T388_9BURK|nr:alpha/beta fold hydrolase [Noviherbaspirillum pedocola]MBK4739007.1 alpha/beta fold hydrolase [Noviherbaspirillum pedocola]